MVMNAETVKQFPLNVQSALANQAFEGFVPVFELTLDEAREVDRRAQERAKRMLKEFRETLVVIPGPAYVKAPR